MSDGNIFSDLGLNLQLLTAGASGGLVKSLFDKSRPLDSMGAVAAGGLTANFFAGSAAQLASSGAMFGYKIQLDAGAAGFFVGLFAFWIVGWLAARLRAKVNEKEPPK